MDCALQSLEHIHQSVVGYHGTKSKPEIFKVALLSYYPNNKIIMFMSMSVPNLIIIE